MKRLATITAVGFLVLFGVAFGLAAWESSSATTKNEETAKRMTCVPVIDRQTGNRELVIHGDAIAMWREGLVDVEGNVVWMEFRGKRRRIPIEEAEDAKFRGWTFVCP